MLKYPTALVILIVLVAGGYYLFQYLRGSGTTMRTPITTMDNEIAYTIEEVAHGLEVPWSIVFTSQARMLVAERPGRIRVIENGTLRAEPLHTFSEVSTGGEEGLMSLAVHPDYVQNRFVYASYAFMTERGMWVSVVRFKDRGSSISDITPIVTGIPAAQYHAGSRLAFGPDKKLYITTGDATERDLAQQMDSLAGKILRVNDDGSIPNDNPFPHSSIWSIGHRNSQGIAWDAQGNLYATEHGPSGFDGPGGGDEVNKIVKGGNYGWPLVSHEEIREGTIAPLSLYTPAEAPASALIYSGNVFPQFKGNLFFGALRGEGLWRVQFANINTIVGQEKVATEYGRIRDVAQGPDGFIYFSTSNRDGRGSPSATDDRIFRLIPKEE